MASRPQAGRTRSATRHRPGARKRRPGARSGPSRVQWDRVGRVALTLVLATVLYSYLNPAIDFVKTYTATTTAKERRLELLQENRRLHDRIQASDQPPVVEREARSQGLVAEEETPVVIRGSLGG
jgi:hypothetical protein